MASTWCVECDSRVYFHKMPELGDTIICQECGTGLEVVGLNPLELDWFDPDYFDPYEDLVDELDFDS